MGLPTEEAEKVFKRVKRNYEGDGKFFLPSLPPSLLPFRPIISSSVNSNTPSLPPSLPPPLQVPPQPEKAAKARI